MKRGTPCRHCGSPALANPCWGPRKAKGSGPCAGIVGRQYAAWEASSRGEDRKLAAYYVVLAASACALAVATLYPEHFDATLRALWGRVTGL